MMFDSIDSRHEKKREQVAKDVEEFLANGGEVEEILYDEEAVKKQIRDDLLPKKRTNALEGMDVYDQNN